MPRGAGLTDLELFVAECGYQAQLAAESGHVAIQYVESGQVAMFDLGDPSHADAHRLCDLPLGEMLAPADLG